MKNKTWKSIFRTGAAIGGSYVVLAGLIWALQLWGLNHEKKRYQKELAVLEEKACQPVVDYEYNLVEAHNYCDQRRARAEEDLEKLKTFRGFFLAPFITVADVARF